MTLKESTVLMLLTISCLTISLNTYAKDRLSYIPSNYLGRFVTDNLDLSTFRNSLGPRRESGMRTFSDFGINPSLLSETKAELTTPDWYYSIEIIKRGDVNGDGVEDLVLCFTDDSREGSYLTRDTILTTRYSDRTLLIALRYEVDGC